MDLVKQKQKPLNWGRQTYIDQLGTAAQASSEFSMQNILENEKNNKIYQLIYADS